MTTNSASGAVWTSSIDVSNLLEHSHVANTCNTTATTQGGSDSIPESGIPEPDAAMRTSRTSTNDTTLMSLDEALETPEGRSASIAANDARDMQRMVLPFDLHRRFTSLTIFGFACILGATWEYALITSLGALTNGGTGGVIWLFFAVMFGMFSVVLSLAEMASIAPTSAGQYHWVSEFAPAQYQRLASYGVGWFTAIGWQASVAGNALIISQQIQALAAFMHPNFNIPTGFNWLTVVLMIAAMLVSTSVNMYGIRLLPWLEAVMFLLHIAGFFAILFPLWIMGERTPSEEVFFTFQDNAGWGSVALAIFVGILGPTVTLVGGDSACHLGEETNNASKALPIAMTSTAIVNYLIGFVMTITILTVSGNFDQDLGERIGQPYLAVIYAATRSYGATVTFGILIIFLFFFCTINCITTTSRQLFAFARDHGLPFSGWLSKVNHKTGLPINSLLVTFAVTSLLSFVAAGSTIAFNNIISISLVGLLLSYGSTILTMLFRRWRSEPLPDSYLKFSRPVGTAINGFALCFVSVAFIFIFFPTAPHPTAASMNWSVVISVGVILFAAGYYAVQGKHTYFGPVVRMQKVDRESTGPDGVLKNVVDLGELDFKDYR